MTPIQLFWLILAASWATIELAIALKTRVSVIRHSPHEYRSERLIWAVVGAALAAALWLKQWHLAALPVAAFDRQVIALVIFTLGLALRCYAVLSLERFFSTTVITRDQHTLIDSGPYRWIRHPAYTGLLCGFLGTGLAMGDGLALLVLVGPVAYVLSQRIHVEEQWLIEHFGEVYYDYRRRTKKLIPWLY